MKKLLLSCFFALGFGANAQYAYVGDFEDPGYNTTIYKQFGGGTRTTAAACNGTNGGATRDQLIGNTNRLYDRSE